MNNNVENTYVKKEFANLSDSQVEEIKEFENNFNLGDGEDVYMIAYKKDSSF